MNGGKRAAMTSERNSAKSDPGQFALEIRVRGKPNVLHTEVCRGLEHAIGIGEKWFRRSRREIRGSCKTPGEEESSSCWTPKPKLCCPLERFVPRTHFHVASRSAVQWRSECMTFG